MVLYEINIVALYEMNIVAFYEMNIIVLLSSRMNRRQVLTLMRVKSHVYVAGVVM